MRILITGANGFIGTYIAQFFINRGEEVIATSRHFNNDTKLLLSKAELLKMDILDKGELQNPNIKADILIHVATANDIVSKDTLKGVELSVMGTKNMLEFAIKNKITKCIIFSTLQVYGVDLKNEITEKSPLNFENDYGANHLFAEILAEQYNRTNKLKCAVVRPSNVFGEILSRSFNRWSLVPGCFCKESFENNTITIKSSGLQMRNFVHLQNLAHAIDCVCKSDMNNFETYNVGSSECMTMFEVAKITKDVYEKRYQKKIDILVEGDQPRETNFFSLSLQKLEKIGFIENKDFNLVKGITQIFNYLENK